MDRERIIAKLRQHEPELKGAGILSLSLFGSVASGDAAARSDIDLMAEFDRAKKISILGRVHLQNRMMDLLGAPVDVADRKMLRPEVLERAQRESILVF
jgi:predicted nucleotidyltransferase